MVLNLAQMSIAKRQTQLTNKHLMQVSATQQQLILIHKMLESRDSLITEIKKDQGMNKDMKK